MFFTGRGDNGYTDLIGGPRVGKDELPIAALGDLDEASSALGLARATATLDSTKAALLAAQRTLYQLMAELATVDGRHAGEQRVTAEHIGQLEATIDELRDHVTLPKDFVAPGDTLPGATLDVARTVVRRAERTVIALYRTSGGGNEHALRYLNRLSSLLFGLARMEDAASGVRPTISKAASER